MISVFAEPGPAAVLAPAVLVLCPVPNSASAAKKPGSLVLRMGAVSVGEGCAADGIPVRNHLQRVATCSIQIERGDKIFRQVDVLPFKVASDEVRRLFVKFQGIRFRGSLELGYRVGGAQLKTKPEIPRSLRLVGVGPQGNREIRFEVFDRDGFVILEFQPLCAKGRNGHDAGAEDGALLGFFLAALPHLQQPRIDRLLLQLVVDLFRALALQNHRGNSRGAIPNGEVGNGGPRRQGENVVALFNAVASALEMRDAVMNHLPGTTIVVKAAAVADFRPSVRAEAKIKKHSGPLTIPLERNPDIIAEIGKQKGNRIVVGFAMGSENLIAYAKDKMLKKNMDFIVANDLSEEGAGFHTDTNIVRIVERSGEVIHLPMMSKMEVADRILDRIKELIDRR